MKDFSPTANSIINYDLFCNESPYPLQTLSLPLSSVIETDYDISSERPLNIPQITEFEIESEIDPILLSQESGNSEPINNNYNHLTVHNQININSRFMPSIEPWKCNQTDDNQQSLTNIQYSEHVMLSILKSNICNL